MGNTARAAFEAPWTKLTDRRRNGDRTAEQGCRAMAYPSGIERAFKDAIFAAAIYADSYERATGRPVGLDPVLGVAFAFWLDGLSGLLNGPTGRHDGGTLFDQLDGIAKAAGWIDGMEGVRAATAR